MTPKLNWPAYGSRRAWRLWMWLFVWSTSWSAIFGLLFLLGRQATSSAVCFTVAVIAGGIAEWLRRLGETAPHGPE